MYSIYNIYQIIILIIIQYYFKMPKERKRSELIISDTADKIMSEDEDDIF
jgi:hypothetical protein